MIPLIRLIPVVLALVGQSDPKEQARQFLDLCQAGKFAEATANFDAKMAEVMPADKLSEVWKGLIKQLGAIKSMGPPRTDRVGASTRVKIRCEFETMPLDALVSFNARGQIEGFFVVPAEKKTAAEEAGPPYVDAARFTEEPITVGARDWPLPGTLTRPKGVASAPLVILVHGSGPNDRDETIGPNKPFRDLAQGLATRGIAVIRYDKRTLEHKQRYSKDKKAADAVTIEEEVIADALATATKARNLPGIDPRRVFLLGHSEGGALAPLIARRDGHLAGVILLAASNRPPDELIRDQLGYIKTLDPSKAEEVGKMQKDIEAALDRIRSGKARDDERIVGASPRFWKSWQGVESARIAGELKGVPFLVLQGGRDYQVTHVDYDAFRTALRGRANTAFHLYPDLNHLFQKGKGKAVPAEYLKPAFVDQRVVEDIAKWVKAVRAS